jgi:hypothetical protein
VSHQYATQNVHSHGYSALPLSASLMQFRQKIGWRRAEVSRKMSRNHATFIHSIICNQKISGHSARTIARRSPHIVMPTAVAEAQAPTLSCRPQWPRRRPPLCHADRRGRAASPLLVMPTAVAEARSAEDTERRHLAPLVSSTGMRSVFRPRNPPRRIRSTRLRCARRVPVGMTSGAGLGCNLGNEEQRHEHAYGKCSLHFFEN